MLTEWRPGSELATLRRRAELLRRTREFFAERGVLEVETPTLAGATVSDPHLDSLATEATSSQSRLFLQTSPEYAMKRLLAAGSGAIYQIGKAYRRGEAGRLHNPEFTLLEWYRPGFDLGDLMNEVEALLRRLLGDLPDAFLGGRVAIPRLSYRQAFEASLGHNPHALRGEPLRELAREHIDLAGEGLNDTDYLQLLMQHCVEPELPAYCFIEDFPAAQAALAQLGENEQGDRVARRFELYGGGMELANGYLELTDAAEQRRRFEADLKRRGELGAEPLPIDEKLLAALDSGLPDCSGVALGFDRLLMLATGADSIDEVLSFSASRI